MLFLSSHIFWQDAEANSYPFANRGAAMPKSSEMSWQALWQLRNHWPPNVTWQVTQQEQNTAEKPVDKKLRQQILLLNCRIYDDLWISMVSYNGIIYTNLWCSQSISNLACCLWFGSLKVCSRLGPGLERIKFKEEIHPSDTFIYDEDK